MSFIHSFEIRPDLVGRPGTRPTQGRVEEKTDEGKTGVTRLTRQDPVANPLTFVFFLLKRRRFDFFKKKLTRSTRSNPVTRLKPRTRALDRAES
jgi:hypothetical protein